MVLQTMLISLMLSSGILEAQPSHRMLRKGNEAYEEQNYAGAEEYYRKSLEERSTLKGSFNLGNAIYQQGRYEESIRRFEHAAEVARSSDDKASAYHNLGNAYLQSGQAEKSIEAYKNALRLRPDDKSTKYNLAQAQRLLKQQQQQQQQDQQQQEQKQQQQQQQEDGGGGQEEPQQQQQEQQQQRQQLPQDQQQQQEPRPGQSESGKGQPKDSRTLTEEEARRLLEIIEEEELRVMEKMKQSEGQSKPKEKDW